MDDDPSAADDTDGTEGSEQSAPPANGAPTVTCSRCDDEWTLGYELDELQAGNRAVEQFAMDHRRHTGHYPDDVTPWVVSCRQCPQQEEFLAERPARRFGKTHVRHTSHTVELLDPDESASSSIQPSETME